MVDTLNRPPEPPNHSSIDPIHTYPTNDWFEHKLEGEDCKCNPEIVKHIGGWQVVHNAFDGREHLESDHDWKNCEVCQADLKTDGK